MRKTVNKMLAAAIIIVIGYLFFEYYFPLLFK